MDFNRNIRKEIKKLHEWMTFYTNFVNGESFMNVDRFARLCHGIMELMSNLEGTANKRLDYSNFLNKMIVDISEEKFYNRLVGRKADEKIKISWIVYYFFGGFLSYEHEDDEKYPLNEKPEMTEFGKNVFRGLNSFSVNFIIKQASDKDIYYKEDGNHLRETVEYHLQQ
jgi:hypothetical protein